MALVYADRVKETTTTTGTGTLNLGGAATGFQGFVAGIGGGNTCIYCIEDGTNWEVGVGTVTDATPDTLSRDTILASSNGGAAVNWGAGSKDVFCTQSAARLLSAVLESTSLTIGPNFPSTTDVFIGQSDVASPTAVTINGQGASGTNIAGANCIIAGGQGTGSGAGGSVKIQHAAAGASGSSQNALADVLTIGDDEVTFAGQMLSSDHGSASVPAYSFNIGGNKAYGMWYGSGKVKFSVNGTEMGHFVSSGFSLARDTSNVAVLLAYRMSVLDRTSSVAENAESQGAVITNSGASAGTTSTLPSAVVGYNQRFVDNNATYRLTVKPNTGDQIIWTDGTIVSAATGSVVSTARYNSFYCVAVDATTWVVMHATGTWTVTP